MPSCKRFIEIEVSPEMLGKISRKDGVIRIKLSDDDSHAGALRLVEETKGRSGKTSRVLAKKDMYHRTRSVVIW